MGCASKSNAGVTPFMADEIIVYEAASTMKASKDEPERLMTLLDMQVKPQKMDLRSKAIREAAQLVALQTAMSWRYKALLEVTEKHHATMDTAFNFSPLIMTQGDALIMPPVLTKAGASMRLEKENTVTTAKTTYELLEPAHYIAIVPTWRDFLFTDIFPEPEQPNPAVLPKNDEEQAIWQEAVREAWVQGVHEADKLYADNVAYMAQTYRGMMLYHMLTAQHLLSRVHTASADMEILTTDKGNKLHIGQKVYRITAPSRFTIPSEVEDE